MNCRKLSRLIGVFTTAVALMPLFALSINHQQTNGASIRPEVADGSGPVPKPPRNVFLADGSGPVPKPPRNIFLADGSGPVVPPVQPTLLPNVLAA